MEEMEKLIEEYQQLVEEAQQSYFSEEERLSCLRRAIWRSSYKPVYIDNNDYINGGAGKFYPEQLLAVDRGDFCQVLASFATDDLGHSFMVKSYVDWI